MTSARISDASLLHNLAGETMQGKMIDYALLVHRNTGLQSKIVEKCIATNVRGITQTMAEYARFIPLRVNIKTERGAINENKVHIQLALWTFAQVKKLKPLMKEGSTILVLPILKIQGNNWRFMLGEEIRDGEIVILSNIRVGMTDSILGIFQIIASVRRLARWMSTVFIPRYDTNILGI